jgi:hypothetical protein
VRTARLGESPESLIGAFFIYARKLVLAKSWNEGIGLGRGHRALLRDYRYLSRLVADQLPPP